MANRLKGSYRSRPSNGRNRGVARDDRAAKRVEAEERNSRTPHNRTKAHREGRCDKSCLSSRHLPTLIDPMSAGWWYDA